ncbi:hypothetical protein F2Q69_00020373 [Brassica cretica]|uniref:Uncharacterized protein n=1 Tax=Brassica cretica TaxID=69181 RepID=A0A8S9QME6_BRACR|nr:hypothetical protein F2Q69_00020373 [Brassica cretica]
MVNKKFGPHLPTIIEARHIETLYELWGIDYAVEIEAPEDGETPETVRPGYCGAYTSHFQDGGLSFPLPRFLLEALAELGMAFAQMVPNFWRYFLASWIRAREEGLKFGLEELKQLFSIRRNSCFSGTMILAPRPGRSIIDGIPNRDDWWTEKFFVFKINPASVGDFAFETIPREWSSEIDRIRAAYALPPGENRATPVGSVVPVRPGKGRRDKRGREKEVLPDRPDKSSEVGSLERAQKTRRGPTLRSRSQTQSPGLLVRPVSIAVPVGGAQRAPNTSFGYVSDRSLDDEIDSPTHQRRRRALEEINSVDPSACLSDVQETSSWRFSYDDEVPILKNPEGVASIWRKLREKGCDLPSLDDMRERDVYLRGELETVRATEKQREVEVEGLKEKLVAAEAEKVALQTDLDLMKDIEGCKATALKERSLARRSLAQEYDVVLAVEVRARIEALAEYSEGGFELDEELECLIDQKISLDLDYGVASVSDPSLSRLDLPEVSSDSVDQE